MHKKVESDTDLVRGVKCGLKDIPLVNVVSNHCAVWVGGCRLGAVAAADGAIWGGPPRWLEVIKYRRPGDIFDGLLFGP